VRIFELTDAGRRMQSEVTARDRTEAELLSAIREDEPKLCVPC
jgi:hypothetical protein